MRNEGESTRERQQSSGGELALIAGVRTRAGSASGRVRLGIGDDCALLRPAAGEELAVTTDFSLETVHFRRDWHTPESVGHRCLARGLSDLAAMGARPMATFLSLALPKELTAARRGQRSWADRFLDGLLALGERMEVSLAGGDTAQSPMAGRPGPKGRGPGLVLADIVLVGGVKRGRALLRSGARAGDWIYVTGALGGAAAELLALERNPARFAGLAKAERGHPHLFPEPRIAAGLKLVRKRLATAAIDLSDGLSTDLRHLCEESGLGAEIEAAAVPIHPMAGLAEAAGWAPSALELALHGGEDYELLFSASPQVKMPQAIGRVAVSRVGKMRKLRKGRPMVQIVRSTGKNEALEAGGWEHFRK